jgi:hypothetical protein
MPASGSNFEGVAAAGDGRVIVLVEEPALLLVFDPPGLAAPLRQVRLDVRSAEGLVGDGFAEGLQAEGRVLLRGGHVLVASEKQPTGLIEFGASGDQSLGLAADAYLPGSSRFELPVGVDAYEALA